MNFLTKSLVRLSVVTFIIAMLTPVTTWAGLCDKHPEHKNCPQSPPPPPPAVTPQYTLTFGAGSDLTLSATGIWSPSEGRFMGLNAYDEITTINLIFFTLPPDSVNSNLCFNVEYPVNSTPLFAATLEQKNQQGEERGQR